MSEATDGVRGERGPIPTDWSGSTARRWLMPLAAVAGSAAVLICGGLVAGTSLARVAQAAEPAEKEDPKKKPAEKPSRMDLLKTFAGEFVLITPGKGEFPATFQMGRADGPAAERPARTVKMNGPFHMAKYEVTQNLYEAVMGQNPSVWGGPRNSVEMVSWRDAAVFCRRATAMMRAAGLIEQNEVIRLPTEAEWEYCCRAGTTTVYSFGDSATQDTDDDTKNQASLLDPYGWHTGNAAGNDPPVGALKPNAWGLYDMHGYLWEYVADNWHASYEGAPQGPEARDDGTNRGPRVMRSGSWRDRAESLTSTSRQSIPDHVKSDAVGFRCVRSARP